MSRLDHEHDPAATRIVVAMSGGVDSSVAAALLKEQGYDVVGITLQLYDHGATGNRVGACCAGTDIHDARRVAATLDMPHYVLDYESRFREEVIENFVDSYLAGETPIPCVRCNQTVKFRDLLATARDLGAVALATGHYVRRVLGAGGPEMHQAADETRDQSYFLFATTREQLDFLHFPLGGMADKRAVRGLAERFGLAVAEKPDSQDICFVPQGRYTDVIERMRPGAAAPGDIVDLEGRVLGRHDGIVRYTVGQRRGLGVGGADQPLYVVRLDPDNRRIVVGPREALLASRIVLRQVNWLGDRPLLSGGEAVVIKVRSTQASVPARLFPGEDGGAVAVPETPEAGVSPGQACVFYRQGRILGGGWIAATEPATAARAA